MTDRDRDGAAGPWRDLTPLFAPRSVAIVGASNDPAKWGNWLARRALQGAHRRQVYLVNRNGGQILGREAYRSLADLPEAVELAVIAVPARGMEQAVNEALRAGVRALVGISAGMGESGEEGRAREQAIVARVRAAGAVLLGPNCLGVFDARAELDLTSNGLPPGPIGLISQSGNLALELAMLASEVDLGFSRFASLGNQADIEAAELVAAFAADDATEVIALYCEDFRDGRAFATAAHGAVSNGKSVVLLTVGASEASVRAARSHTGALASSSAAVDAACAAAGIERVATPQQLIDMAQALRGRGKPRGRRIGILADGGGHGAIAAEIATGGGLAVPAFSPELSQRLASELPPTASTANPVDMAGGGEQDLGSFARVVRAMLDSGELDAVLMTGYFGGYAEYGEGLAQREREVAGELAGSIAADGKPLVVHTMHARSAAAAHLRASRVPVYRTVEAAIGALSRLAARSLNPPDGVPRLPPPAAPIAEAGYWQARELFAGAGIPFVPARRVRTLSEARDAAAELGYPLALKALGLEHKSDRGGVVLGLDGDDALRRAFVEMEARLSPPGFSLERMARLADGVELLLGCRRDARFGAIAVAGLGGIYTEILADVAVGLAPLDAAQARRMLRSLRGARLLSGVRGRPAVDVAAAANVLVALSHLAAAHPEIDELEINPLLVLPDGAVALDARLIVHG